MRYETGAPGERGATKKMIADEQYETTHLRKGKRSQNTAPTQNTYVNTPGHIISGTIPPGNTAQKLPRQQTGATASNHRQTKGGSHESGRFYCGATAATDRHRQPAALLFVVVRRSSMSSSSILQLYHNNSTDCST